MAIQVNGTSVISDSRQLQNVTGLKTVNSTSLLGTGNIDVGKAKSGTYTSSSSSYTLSTGVPNGVVFGSVQSASRGNLDTYATTTDSSGNATINHNGLSGPWVWIAVG